MVARVELLVLLEMNVSLLKLHEHYAREKTSKYEEVCHY